MVGGICFRNFGAPRLVAVMIILSLGPCCPAGAISGEPILLLILVQIPFYLFAMSLAAFRLNGLLVSTMKAEKENDHRARHDLLTGLPNRAGLILAIDSTCAAVVPHESPAAVFYIDLDGFKPVNDRYGHAAGDALLVMVSMRLRTALGTAGIVGRIGGDEFVVLVHVLQRDQLPIIAERLLREVSLPYDLGSDSTILISASIGVALIPDHGVDVDTVLKAADTALYAAKREGKTCWSLAQA
jgi:diguanylate cyclase (GGDEF)-like protein